MAGQIRMTPSVMRDRAGEYLQQSEELQSIITNLNGLLDQLQGEWEGQASRAYADQFEDFGQPNLHDRSCIQFFHFCKTRPS